MGFKDPLRNAYLQRGEMVLTLSQIRLIEDYQVPTLEVTKEAHPILAHRAARLWLDGSDEPFGSIFRGRSFGVDALAECLAGISQATHVSPSPPCTCGFYALPPDLPSTNVGDKLVNLQVELYGRVIVCEKGYRAQFQRVIECQLPSCVYCGRKADLVLTSMDVVGRPVFLGASCKSDEGQFNDHVRTWLERPSALAVDDIQDLIPVPVTLQGT